LCIRKPVSFEIIESDLHHQIKYTWKTFNKTLLCLINQIIKIMDRVSDNRRLIAIAGPPGCGKSTIALTITELLKQHNINAVVLPMDGFHRKNSDLRANKTHIGKREVTLYDIKGAKETYDTAYLFKCIERLKRGEKFYWPIYSRSLHEPVENGILIDGKADVYFIEGNYLFLKTEPWSKLSSYFSLKIFIRSKKRFLRHRLISRKIKGGFSRREARDHYKLCDRRNIDEVLSNSTGFDFVLNQKGKYNYRLNKKY
jgi:hypothetical protein